MWDNVNKIHYPIFMIDDKLKKALKDLARSSCWKIVRDYWIIPEMQKLYSIYDDRLKLDMPEGDFKTLWLAKQQGYGLTESIYKQIDQFDTVIEKRGNQSWE
jgi:hypothetical protein